VESLWNQKELTLVSDIYIRHFTVLLADGQKVVHYTERKNVQINAKNTNSVMNHNSRKKYEVLKMNYENLPTRVKQASDGEVARLCWCSGLVAVHYDEAAVYRVECENCGTLMTFKAPSHDWAIKMWNDMPAPVGNDESTKRNYSFKIDMDRANDLRIIRNFLEHMPKVYRLRNSNWVVVRDILMNGTSTSGCTSCCEKCRELGIDPYGYKLA